MTPDLDEIRRVLAAATPRHPDIENADYDRLVANAPTWLAALCTEVERLRELSAQLQVEQDAALTEVERIKEINALNGRRCLAWRACADQLAAALREHVRLTRPIQSTREALAEYERLKGGMNGRHQDL